VCTNGSGERVVVVVTNGSGERVVVVVTNGSGERIVVVTNGSVETVVVVTNGSVETVVVLTKVVIVVVVVDVVVAEECPRTISAQGTRSSTILAIRRGGTAVEAERATTTNEVADLNIYKLV
jgi:hypothetical protein